MPHLTLAPPQTVDERDLDQAVALVERAAAEAVPFLVELDGAATFLPDNPVAYLVVREGGPALAALEAALRESPLHRRTHPFHPHVTLVQDLPPDRVELAARELAGFGPPSRSVSWCCESGGTQKLGRVWRPLTTATVGASTAIREVPFTEAASVALLVVDPGSARVLLDQRTRGQEPPLPRGLGRDRRQAGRGADPAGRTVPGGV